MNVEVEVVEERITTWVVEDVRTLERAEKLALESATKRQPVDRRIKRSSGRRAEFFVRWSAPLTRKK